MPSKAGLGFSQNADTIKAIQEAAEQAKESLPKKRIDAALIFNTKHYDPQVFIPIAYQTLDQTKLIGCSTGGVIFKDNVYARGIGIIAVYSEDITFESGYISHLDMQDINIVGQMLVEQAIADLGKSQEKLLMVLSDNINIDTENLLMATGKSLANKTMILGAGSSDSFSLKNTNQYHRNVIMSNGLAGLFLGGSLVHVGFALQHGWKPLGKPRTITGAEKKIITNIQKEKASVLYKDFFGDEAISLHNNAFGHINIRYPLGIKKIDDSKEYLLRHVLRDQSDGSLVCQNNVAENSEIHIMIGNKDSCIMSAENAAIEVKDQLKGRSPNLILIIESMNRYKMLGSKIHEEILVIKKVLGESVPLLGMCSYGEIWSDKDKNNTFTPIVQNGSIAIIAIS